MYYATKIFLSFPHFFLCIGKVFVVGLLYYHSFILLDMNPLEKEQSSVALYRDVYKYVN